MFDESKMMGGPQYDPDVPDQQTGGSPEHLIQKWKNKEQEVSKALESVGEIHREINENLKRYKEELEHNLEAVKENGSEHRINKMKAKIEDIDNMGKIPMFGITDRPRMLSELMHPDKIKQFSRAEIDSAKKRAEFRDVIEQVDWETLREAESEVESDNTPYSYERAGINLNKNGLMIFNHSVEDFVMPIMSAVEGEEVKDIGIKTLDEFSEYYSSKENKGSDADDSEGAKIDKESDEYGAVYSTVNMTVEKINKKKDSMSVDEKKEFLDYLLSNEKLQEVKNTVDNFENVEGETNDYRQREYVSAMHELVTSLPEDDSDRSRLLVELYNDAGSNIPEGVLEEVFDNNDIETEKKQELFTKVFGKLDKQAKRFGEYNLPDDLKLNKKQQLMLKALEAGVEIDGLDEKIETMKQDTDYINDPNVGRKWANIALSDIQAFEERARAIQEGGREDLGAGFNVESSDAGMKLFMDGELVGVYKNAELSEQPSNGEVVSWTTKEQIDYDTVKGSPQYRTNVYAFKKGADKPEVVHDEHGYTHEKKFSVTPPVVQEDGTITFEVTVNGETETKEVTV